MLKPMGYSNGTICDLDQARELNFSGAIVLIDGKRMNSFDELVRLVEQDINKNKEPIEVIILPAVTGG
jgi:hypothetical protein